MLRIILITALVATISCQTVRMRSSQSESASVGRKPDLATTGRRTEQVGSAGRKPDLGTIRTNPEILNPKLKERLRRAAETVIKTDTKVESDKDSLERKLKSDKDIKKGVPEGDKCSAVEECKDKKRYEDIMKEQDKNLKDCKDDKDCEKAKKSAEKCDMESVGTKDPKAKADAKCDKGDVHAKECDKKFFDCMDKEGISFNKWKSLVKTC